MSDKLFWNKVEKTDTCWNWIGYIENWGYGKLTRNNRQVYAHRYSYEMSKGAIPEGHEVDHLCRNRACVNPEHLEAVTKKVNILRGQGSAANNLRKTHCPQGHPYNYSYPNGWRRCRTCLTEQDRRWRLKKELSFGNL